MATTTGKASDINVKYDELSKTLNLTNQWTDYFLKPLQQQYQEQASAVSATATKDISQAYANYKQQQMAIAQNAQLGTGFKEKLADQLYSDYKSTYGQVKSEEMQTLSDIATKYGTDYLELQENLNAFDEAVWNFAQEDEGVLAKYKGIADPTKWAQNVTEGGLQLFTPEDELTQYGIDFYDYILNSVNTSKSFVKSLDKDLADFYRQNAPAIREAYGLSPEGSIYGEERASRLREQEFGVYEQRLTDAGANLDVINKIYGNWTNLSGEQVRELITNTQRNSDYVGSAKIGTVHPGKSVKDSSGNEWTVASWGDSVNPNKILSSQDIDKGGHLTATGKDKYKTGDIIYKNGKYYHVTVDHRGKEWLFGGRELYDIRLVELFPGDFNRNAIKFLVGDK